MNHRELFTRIASFGVPTILLGIALAASAYALFQISGLSGELAQLRMELASTTALLAGNITETHSAFEGALSEEKKNVSVLQRMLAGFQDRVEGITGAVSTLEKLSRTDPELLQKYSKVFFLNEHYAPERLVEIPAGYGYSAHRTYRIHSAVWPYLKALLDEAKEEGVELYVFSAFRSFNEQDALKGAYSVTYGAGTANQFSADQGYSEHQLGTTVDFMTTGIGGTLAGFENTKAYEWLLKNAHRRGFVLSYPKGNNHYIFEPWHWRFVGEELAQNLFNDKKDFYDLEQREIDEYLVNIFD